MNEPRATISASEPSYRACLVERVDLVVGEPGLDRVKLCHCGSSRNSLAGFRESEWVRRGVVGDMGICQKLAVYPGRQITL